MPGARCAGPLTDRLRRSRARLSICGHCGAFVIFTDDLRLRQLDWPDWCMLTHAKKTNLVATRAVILTRIRAGATVSTLVRHSCNAIRLRHDHVSWRQAKLTFIGRVKMEQLRRHLDAAELKRRISTLGVLLRQLEAVAFDDHVTEPMRRLRAAYRAAASAHEGGVIRLCQSPDCLNRDRGLRTRAEEYCSERCFARERRRRFYEPRRGVRRK